MKNTVTKQEHEVVYQELVALVKRHEGLVSSLEILAIASNMVGKLVAMQDQRSVTPVQAMSIVANNIEEGNRQVLATVLATKGNA